jgi:glutathione S-transferase
MTTKATERTSLEIKRFVNAPRERVYAAWTELAELQRWFGPEEVRTIKIAADVRVGGKYRWDLVKQDGEQWACLGEYRELVPGRKIVFTWKWEDDEAWENHDSVVTVELSDRDGGTEVKLTHEKLPSEESRDRHNEGWNSVLDRLEKFLL